MNNFLSPLKRHGFFIALGLIVFVGAFLRFYHFGDWLHFGLDQSRDAKVIDIAVEEGPGRLPLFGPRAGGTFLRLGPVFYYLEYLSALIFGDKPSGMAIITLIFGILTLPLFYAYARLYFDQRVSLMLLALFSVSYLLVVSSRFAWNPNPLPFFTLLALYGLMRSVKPDEKHPARWLLIGALGIAVATQLHFLAFVALPAYAFFFLIAKRPRFSWKQWLAALFIVVLMYVPAIVNDLHTGGANTKEFFKAVGSKSSKDDNGLIDRLVRNSIEHASHYGMILSGHENFDTLRIRIPESNLSAIDIRCNQDCQKELPIQAAEFFLSLVALAFLIRSLRREQDSFRRTFLFSTALYLGITFALLVPTASYLSPRFFLFAMPLPFVLLGLIIHNLEQTWPRLRWATLLFVLLLVISNLWFVFRYFSHLRSFPTLNQPLHSHVILQEDIRSTLEHQLIISRFIESYYQQNHYPVYFNSDPELRRSIRYHLTRAGVPNVDLRDLDITGHFYRNGNYFILYDTTKEIEQQKERYAKRFTILDTKPFGTVTLARIAPKEEIITDQEQVFEAERRQTGNVEAPKRFEWNEILDGADEEEE